MQPQKAPTPQPDRRPLFSYLLLARVPLLMLLAIVGFLPAAQSREAGAYLRGMYDLTWKGALLVGAASFLLGMAINVAANTIVRTAELRFGMRPIWTWLSEPVRVFRSDAINKAYGVWRINVILGAITTAGLLYFFWGLQKYSQQGWLAFGGAVAGLLATFGIGYLVARAVAGGAPGHGWYIRFVRHFSPDGFVLPNGDPVPGHQFSANSFLLSLILYAVLGYFFHPGQAVGGLDLAALVSLLLVLTNLCWLLSGVTYLLDRWRIPLLLIVIAVAMLAGNRLLTLIVIGVAAFVSWIYSVVTGVSNRQRFLVLLFIAAVSLFLRGNDHVFAVRSCNNCNPSKTAAGILDVAAGPGQPRILVATSGGGILAASWTAKVLGELTEQNPGFTKALRLISSVSGGSVGSMHYVHSLKQGNFDKNAVFAKAASSSLDSVAWGLAYYDSWRVLGVNNDPEKDRALELRHAWTRHDPGLDQAMLSQWAAGDGIPAIMINSTIAETGERFSFTNFNPGKTEGPAVRRVFWDYYKGQDIEVSAAVANSAAFPYVSPAARASAGPAIHLLDGGYYDNFGVASALDFLYDGYADKRDLANQRILVILIEAGAADAYTSLDGLGDSENWGFQLSAPPKGLLRMWQIAARQRNYDALKWLREFNVAHVSFVYRGQDSPTSWHLTEDNRKEIEGQYTAGNNSSAAEEVRQYLASFTSASSGSAKTP